MLIKINDATLDPADIVGMYIRDKQIRYIFGKGRIINGGDTDAEQLKMAAYRINQILPPHAQLIQVSDTMFLDPGCVSAIRPTTEARVFSTGLEFVLKSDAVIDDGHTNAKMLGDILDKINSALAARPPRTDLLDHAELDAALAPFKPSPPSASPDTEQPGRGIRLASSRGTTGGPVR